MPRKTFLKTHGESPSNLHIYLTTTLYERVSLEAHKREMSKSSLIRSILFTHFTRMDRVKSSRKEDEISFSG